MAELMQNAGSVGIGDHWFSTHPCSVGRNLSLAERMLFTGRVEACEHGAPASPGTVGPLITNGTLVSRCQAGALPSIPLHQLGNFAQVPSQTRGCHRTGVWERRVEILDA